MSAWKLLPRTAEKQDRQQDAWSEAAAKHYAKLCKLEPIVPGIAEGTARLLRFVAIGEHRLYNTIIGWITSKYTWYDVLRDSQ